MVSPATKVSECETHACREFYYEATSASVVCLMSYFAKGRKPSFIKICFEHMYDYGRVNIKRCVP